MNISALSAFAVKPIALPRHRLDQPVVARGRELALQPVDMGVYAALLDQRAVDAEVLHELAPREGDNALAGQRTVHDQRLGGPTTKGVSSFSRRFAKQRLVPGERQRCGDRLAQRAVLLHHQRSRHGMMQTASRASYSKL